LPFVLLSEFQAEGFTLLVNATPIGREDDSLPFAIDSLSRDTVVVDLAYGARPTPLVAGMHTRGNTVIDGYDVALTQVRKQFYMMVGREMPHSVGREAVFAEPFAGRPRHGVEREQETREYIPQTFT
jgi:3-dehydroquinate dehydratase / shikimate dehydrogenase